MRYYFIISAFLLAAQVSSAQKTAPIYSSKSYSVYPDKVVQGRFEAKVLSDTAITSNYQSPANEFKSPVITFKFSINGKDNEMASGKDHMFKCVAKGGAAETPVIQFGHQFTDPKRVDDNVYIKPGTRLKVRLDMRNVFKAFDKQGYYVGANGDKIYKTDFKGVFLAGNTGPMIWDFNNLVNHPELQLKDPDGNGIYETTLILNEAKNEKSIASSWKRSRNIGAFPQYHSDYPISDAIYNLSIEEMQKAVEPDSTFRTGKEWSGVWTRDISYSIILSMAVLQPKVAMYSLMSKVKNGRIIQDTGTGGAYPCSSDRMIWAVAAWEVYKVTGDRDWLKKVYQIIRKSVEDDELNVYDQKTGMVRGESSFLDWREETYPKWMQPADIYQSECLGTNAVHYQVNKVLSLMAGLAGDQSAADKYSSNADRIKAGVQRYLWLPEKGYFAQYLYGRNYQSVSPRSEALGEALVVLFDLADQSRQQSVVNNTPVTGYGIPCIYPQIPGILPYHNNAVWPFVESYWALAGAKVGNEASVLKSISAIYRATALFVTNKENFVSTNGDYAGTQINSSNMLWSLSGNIALVYKLLFGMHYEPDALQFKPFVPKALAGDRSLRNYRYRNAILDITLSGYGNEIRLITMDGNSLKDGVIPASLTGKHAIAIQLANHEIGGKINMSPDYTSPATAMVYYTNGQLRWSACSGAASYQILKNGKTIGTTTALNYQVNKEEYAEYQVVSVDARGKQSFASEPVDVTPAGTVIKIEAENFYPKADLGYAGYSGAGFVNLSTTENTHISIPADIDKSGTYAISFRYGNGNGPINTENKCAIRTLSVNNKFTGTIVLPQRGKGEWSDWGFTNPVMVKLDKGKNSISLDFKAANANMNGDVNQATLDYVKLIRLK